MSKIIVSLTDLRPIYKSLKTEFDEAFEKVSSQGLFRKGPFLEKFEKEFAKFIGVKYCIGVASGTDALTLSLMVLDLKKGDEVIIPANTFVAAAYACLFVGVKPVLVDIDPKTYNMDPSQVEKKITKKTKVIFPTHLYGQSAQMDQIMKIAKKYKLKVVEDACQAHGATYHNQKVGSFGDLSTFSFYVSKNLGAFGDGGAVVTNSPKLAKEIFKLREYGGLKAYVYDRIGLNSRLDALQAAILSIKLKHLSAWNNQRKTIADYYTQRLNQELPQIITPYIDPKARHVFHLYIIQTPKRNQLLEFLLKKGIQVGIHYPVPIHLQRSLRNIGFKKGDFPITEMIASRILSLPMYPEITKIQQDLVIDSIKEFFNS